MKRVFSFSVLLLQTFGLLAQITTDIRKPGWNAENLSLNGPQTIHITPPDLAILLSEDSLNASKKDIPWRFGYAIERSIDFMQAADRETHEGMVRLRLVIEANAAKSLNFNFSHFQLSNDALFYISSLDAKDALGAITAKNNKIGQQFSSRPIKGSTMELTLFVPADQVAGNSIMIKQIVYGYKDVFAKSAKNFNSSGGCNRNTNCPEALLWQDLVRSVVLITASNNTRLCTGTLINNVREDSTPYILTASHCNLATNSIFVFNYENSSNNCTSNANGSLANSISVATDRAESSVSFSDFKLFELSQKPPASYNAYYAGWNANPEAAFESTTIHHPSGDIKKISQDFDTVRSTFFLPPNQDTHWQVGNWESGTTEPGSSGAALFDQNKRIVGQLEGGTASCNNISNDYYGKFSLSWDANAASNRQLKVWLDPDSTNVLTLDGMDPIAKLNNQDVELTYVSNVPAFSCDSTIKPKVHFLNRGNTILNSILIEYGVNQQFNASVNWTGSIETDELIEFQLPPVNLALGDSSFNVRLAISPQDQDTTNNHWSKSIRLNPGPITIPLTFKSDQYGYESSWEIIDLTSQRIVAKGGPYVETTTTSGAIYQDSLCLYDSCFQLKIFDSFGDGFNGSFGQGYLLIQDQKGDTLALENNFTGSQRTINFCVNSSVGLDRPKRGNLRFSLYPNPVERAQFVGLSLNREIQDLRVEIYDLQGKLIQSSRKTEFRLNLHMGNGLYIVRLLEGQETIGRTKLLVQ